MKKILSFIIAAVGVFGFASCTPEEIFTKDGKTPLESPVITVGEVTANSISFSWDAIENANQYFYKVVNPAGYIVSKGDTEDTFADVKGLKFSTEFTVLVSAIPSADVARTYCASEPTQIKITTDDPIIISYEWVQNGKAWFYSGDDKWNIVDVTVGREQGTGHFIITSYCGAEGFDFYFDMTKFEGSYPFDFNSDMKNMKPVEGQAIDMEGPLGSRPDFHLAHGLGGKAEAYNIFYGDGGSYEYGVIDPSGGYIDFWTTNFDNQWCGYRVEFGDYKAPEPAPWVPDEDMSFAWSAEGEIFIDGESTKTYASISYTGAAQAEYTISGWYGVEGYDLVFTRNQEDGTWIINKDKSSAYAGVCPGDGLYGYLHGAEGKSKINWINDDAKSGFSGTDTKGQIWIDIIDPDGNEVTYSLQWPAILSNGDADYDWSRTANFEFDGTTGTATVSYVAETGTYTIEDWMGVEGLNIVFTRLLSGEWQIDRTASTSYVRDGDYSDIGLNSGISGAATVWFHEDESGMTGDDKAGSLYITGWSHKSNWTTYTISWADEDWTATGHMVASGINLDIEATISYSAESGKYTISNWYGSEARQFVFTVNSTKDIVVDPTCSAYWDESDDRWNLHPGDYDGVLSVFKGEGSSIFIGGQAGGSLKFGGEDAGWYWDSTDWGSFSFTW